MRVLSPRSGPALSTDAACVDPSALAELVGGCPVCGGDRSVPDRALRGWTLVRCTDCSMIYVDPAPTEEALEIAYALPKSEYDRFFGTERIDTRRILGGGGAAWQAHASDGYLRRIERRLGRTGRILDVGCGSGVFLETALRRGWIPAGVDPGDWIGDSDRDRRLGIYRGPLDRAGFRSRTFDAIHMGSVLEHVLRPGDLLAGLRDLLVPGGVLHVAGLPNIRSFTIRLGVDRWIGNHPPLHLQYFSRKTVRRLFLASGFDAIRVACYGIPETVLEAIFHREGGAYSGSYTAGLAGGGLRARVMRRIRAAVYTMLDLTGTGSVLEVLARRPSHVLANNRS